MLTLRGAQRVLTLAATSLPGLSRALVAAAARESSSTASDDSPAAASRACTAAPPTEPAAAAAASPTRVPVERLQRAITPAVCDALRRQGFAVVDNALGEAAAALLRQELAGLRSAMHKANVAAGQVVGCLPLRCCPQAAAACRASCITLTVMEPPCPTPPLCCWQNCTHLVQGGSTERLEKEHVWEAELLMADTQVWVRGRLAGKTRSAHAGPAALHGQVQRVRWAPAAAARQAFVPPSTSAQPPLVHRRERRCARSCSTTARCG